MRLVRGSVRFSWRHDHERNYRMNPNICTFCELMFSRVMKATKITIDATILFADLRAYTRLSQEISPAEMGNLLDLFYDECAAAIWEHAVPPRRGRRAETPSRLTISDWRLRIAD